MKKKPNKSGSSKFAVTGAKKGTVKKGRDRERMRIPLKPMVPIAGKKKKLDPAKVKKALKKAKDRQSNMKGKIDELSIQDLMKQMDSGKIAPPSAQKGGKFSGPRSEEDFRLEYVDQLAKLKKIEKALLADYEMNDNGRAVYQLLQVLQQQNAVFDALWDLKTVEGKIAAIANRILEPAFRKVTMVATDMMQEVRRTIGKLVVPKEAKRLDEGVLEVTRRFSKDFQACYEHALEQTAAVAEEDL